MTKSFCISFLMVLLLVGSISPAPVTCYAQPAETPARVFLEVDNDSPETAENIRFRVSTTLPFQTTRYDFVFGDGSTLWTESPEAEHAYEKEGIYRAYARAVVNDNFHTSNTIVIRVEKRLSLPVVKIYPVYVRARQGERVRFESRSTVVSPARIERQEWTGPNDLKAEGPVFDIETGNLAPDIYEIYLEVTDNYRQTESTRAILEIQPVDIIPPLRSAPENVDRTPVRPDERTQGIPWGWICLGIIAGFAVGYLVREYLLKKPVIKVQSEYDKGVQNIEGDTVPPIEGEIRLKTVPDRGEQTIGQEKVSIIDERREDG